MNTDAQTKVLVVDDDQNFLKVISFNLTQQGLQVTVAHDGLQALELFKSEAFDLILSDVRMPQMDGLTLLDQIRQLHEDTPMIMITAHGDVEMAVQAMQAGATDFLTKPFDRMLLQKKIERALKLKRLEQENRVLREELVDRFSFENIVGNSAPMRQLFDLMRRVAHRDATVLILGESGTGKELVARAVHYASSRRDSAFVAINCAAIPPNLLESELFGHEKGAFTGADRAREGRFQVASGGTLFLDEIGDMPLDLQAKLLRVLQERVVEPVGSSKPVPVNVRIIAATNKDLEQLVRSGDFRQDLFYRLNVVPLYLPPLRDRREDIPLLVRHFLVKMGESKVVVEREAMEVLSAFDWPGNVRELENAMERALALRADPNRITPADIMLYSPREQAESTLLKIPDEGIVLDELEKKLIISALAKTGRNQTRAAQLLGITRQQLIYRMGKYEIQ